MRGDLKVFSGTAHPELAKKVCEHLNLPLGQAEIFKFANDNTFVAIKESVRQADVFLIQPSCPPVNDGLMELLIMIDALKRASARSVAVVCPYYPYVRSDKKDQPRVAITARLIGDLLTAAGADRIVTVDLHAPQVQGFLKICLDHLSARQLIADYFRSMHLDNGVVVAPDAGAAKQAEFYAGKLDLPYAIIDKRRVDNRDRPVAQNIIGDVQGKTALIFDDEISTGNSLKETVRVLNQKKVKEILVGVVHPAFCRQATANLADPLISKVVVTDTLPVTPGHLPKLHVLSVAKLLADTIRYIHTGQSISQLLECD
ncbi:MAG TPA: ribose-phosphate pyrophosphokinase [Verrucomicrobiae bacterium]|nr:ribose-phosphate pyrophosphokinase [Verrucomicrobiae bacterium]